MRIRLKSSRIISVIICILLLTALIPVSVFAGNDALRTAPAFNYVALGDASTAGFGMSADAGYGVLTEGTYPAVIAEILNSKGLPVNVSQMAEGGMRPEEIRYLLDDTYNGDGYLQETFPDLSKKRSEYQSAIRNADLITYALGTVNFGSYLLYVAGDIETRCSDPQVKALTNADSDGVKAALKNALNAEIAKVPGTIRSTASSMGYDLDELVGEYADSYIEAAAYVYYSFSLSYSESIRLIREMNPNADIIVLGLNNMLGDLYLDAIGVKFELGALYNEQVVIRANNKLKSAAGIHSFIDTNNVDRFMDEINAYSGDAATISQQFKDYCDIYEDDLQIKKQINKDLSGYAADAKERAAIAAYDTVASSLQSVSGVNGESFDLSTLLYAKDNKDALTAMGKDLMNGLKSKAMEFAKGRADSKYFVYSSKLKKYIDGKTAGAKDGDLYGSDSTMRKFGRVIMAIGIRAKMGDGFFQQPTTTGHSQLAQRILDKYQMIHRAKADPTCEKSGNLEFWFVTATGKYFSDEACTQEISADSIFTAPLGHDYKPVEGTAVDATCTTAGKEADQKCDRCNSVLEGKEIEPLPHDWGDGWKVTKKAAFCKDGEKQRRCSTCDLLEVAVIPGKGPANTKIKKLVPAKKAFTVRWKLPSKANLKKTTGYEIRYSLKSSMASSKTVKITKNKITSKAIKKLKAKKKYYVQIRTYKKVGKKLYRSAWSAKKSVKTK